MKESSIDRPFIKSPFLSKIIELFDSLRFKKAHFGAASCFLLTGESGSGKSELAKYYLKNNPVVEQAERTYIPVVHFELKSISTPQEFLRSMLVTIGDPQQGLGARNKGELYERLVRLIKVTGIELLILDEIQVIIERRSAKVVTGIADLFKDLIKDTQLPIVFMGMPWSTYLIDSNQQLRRRIAYRYVIPPYRISQKEYREDYRRLLKLLADAYEISKDIKLEELSMALRFFGATNGNLAITSDLIFDAFMRSKMENKKVDIALLAGVLGDYGIHDDCNPFLLPIEKLELKELIVYSDWHFGNRANKNSIIEAEYAMYGVTSDKKLYAVSGVA
ncbi:TniB family NTP-binding protein [Cellvibrio mixtus]|uniref:TniB family NTP-binding protein n=1 Tax=Cellvibrio mixtus TaxID=39650 RepID=UPI0005864F6F|nr:TniB family NTP-binding protein [Cellvibrio mixtus]